MERRAQKRRRAKLVIKDGPFSRSGAANLVMKDQHPLVNAA